MDRRKIGPIRSSRKRNIRSWLMVSKKPRMPQSSARFTFFVVKALFVFCSWFWRTERD